MKVPPRFERAVTDTLAAYDAIDARIARGEPRGTGNAAFALLNELVTKLSLDRAAHPQRVEVSELTADQRAVLVALTDGRWVPVESVAEVPRPWARRQWLGLTPPGILETVFGASLPADLDAAIARLPSHQRVEAMCEAMLAGRSIESAALFATLRKDAPHALAYARTTLPQLPLFDNWPLPRVVLFTAFSASGATVPEGVDEHFPLAYRMPGEPLSERVSTGFLVEHLKAVAEPRRDQVLASAIRRNAGGTYQAAMYLLEQCGPLPRSSESVRRYLESTKKKPLTGFEKKTIADLARRLKAIAAPPKPKPKKR